MRALLWACCLCASSCMGSLQVCSSGDADLDPSGTASEQGLPGVLAAEGSSTSPDGGAGGASRAASGSGESLTGSRGGGAVPDGDPIVFG